MYKLIPFNDYLGFAFTENKDIGSYDKEIELLDYYPRKDNSDLIIIRDNTNKKIKINLKKPLDIDYSKCLYDYDKLSDTLIVYREENKNKIIGIYTNDTQVKSNPINEFCEDSTLNKIYAYTEFRKF